MLVVHQHNGMLRLSGRTLLSVLVAGQGLFAAYLVAGYGRTALTGDFAAWARLSAHGWISGDHWGNAAMLAHITVAAAILVSGGIQLLPWIRRRAPAVHRWTGRAFIVGCGVGALSGLQLVWWRGTVGDTTQHVAISINAVLVLVCGTMAWRRARERSYAAHRVWALRTYLVAGGVFYFRILLALWLVIHRRPVGFDPNTFSGPFLTALSIGVYVVGPLMLFAGYRYAERSQYVAARRFVSGLLAATGLICAAGIAAAVMVLWLPKLGR